MEHRTKQEKHLSKTPIVRSTREEHPIVPSSLKSGAPICEELPPEQGKRLSAYKRGAGIESTIHKIKLSIRAEHIFESRTYKSTVLKGAKYKPVRNSS